MGSNNVPAPEEHLGFRVGTDRKLADWPEIVDYFMKVAEASPRVQVENLGETTLGNPFLAATVSSPENLGNLEELRAIQMRLSKPDGLSDEEAESLIKKGKTVALISCSIHSTEVGGSQMSMELLHRLATDDGPEVKEILDNVVFLFVPSLNPDGNRIVCEWYNRYLGTEWEGSGPPYVYHEYAGHDNNRDWYMFTLKETQMTIEHVHNMWHPQIVYDIHQMGSKGPRFYVPPFIDPYEPNIDPVLTSGVNFMGISMADALAREDKGGVATHWVFDAWTPARAYQHHHGGIRILSEAASVKIASPIEVKPEEMETERGFNPKASRWNHPIPWKGGAWTLRDIIEYEYTAAFACLQTAAKFRKRWLRGTLAMGRRAMEPAGGPYAFVISTAQRDQGALKELLWVLRMGDVEVHVSEGPFTADGVEYPAGSYVVKYAQPYGNFAKTMLENQVYPDLRESPDAPPKVPYDVTAHTLSLQLGVEVSQVGSAFEAKLKPIEMPTLPKGVVHGRGKPYYVFSAVPNYAYKAANRLLDAGYKVSRCMDVVELEDVTLKPGAFVVDSGRKLIHGLAEELGLDFYGVDEPLEDSFELVKPRVGVYRAHLPNADEGWLRMVLEEYDFSYVNLYPEDVRAGGVRKKVDVLIVPDMTRDIVMKGMAGQKWMDPKTYEPKYRRGIEESGNREMLKFLEQGGTVVTLNRACEYAVKELWAGAELATEGLDQKELYCPGSLLRVMVDDTHPVGYGFSREEAVMYLHSPAFKVKDGFAVAWYPEADPLLSGWILGEKHLRGLAAVAECPAGDGTILMLGCEPHFRNQNRATFKLLFNSIFYGAA
ncbi:hypothetical protein JXL21_08990 [Candidatus Bathyarchaeota archaeon]|nr:hypothetical protein [Candidatus Bathyarchaeota archaeon]